VQAENEQVTFRYYDNKGNRRYGTLPVYEFMRRFLQHVLPKGFKKVRYYGLFSPAKRALLHRIRLLLLIQKVTQAAATGEPEPQDRPAACPAPPVAVRCDAWSNLSQSGVDHRDEDRLSRSATAFGSGSGCFRPASLVACCW